MLLEQFPWHQSLEGVLLKHPELIRISSEDRASYTVQEYKEYKAKKISRRATLAQAYELAREKTRGTCPDV